MKVSRIEDTVGGWYIGNFPAAAYQTKGFEVSYKIHKKDEDWAWHYHEHLDEINLLISGSMIMCGQTLRPGDIFIVDPKEIADPVFLEDCHVICVKAPNFTNDKIVVERS